MNRSGVAHRAGENFIYGHCKNFTRDAVFLTAGRHESGRKEAFLKKASMVAIVSLLLGFSGLTVHAADKKDEQASTSIHAERSPEIADAWARATVPGQAVGAAYMKIISPAATTLINIESDASKATEVHSMTHQNGVMKMRRLNKLDVPAGQTVDLAPGGNHLMLLGLKKPLKAGESLKLKMTFVDDAGTKTIVPVHVPIRPFGQ